MPPFSLFCNLYSISPLRQPCELSFSLYTPSYKITPDLVIGDYSWFPNCFDCWIGPDESHLWLARLLLTLPARAAVARHVSLHDTLFIIVDGVPPPFSSALESDPNSFDWHRRWPPPPLISSGSFCLVIEENLVREGFGGSYTVNNKEVVIPE